MSALSLPLWLAFVAPAPEPAPPVSGAPTSAAAPVDAPPAAAPDVAPVASPATSEPAPTSAPAVASAPVYAAPVAPAPPPPLRKPPPEHGPFFAGEPASDTAFPNGPRPADPPRFSLGRGAFCFVDDSFCKTSLILTADIGIGTNIVGGPGTSDLPYAHYNFRGGLVMKPLMLGRQDGWHPWGIGLLGSWSRGTGAPSKESAVVSPHTDTTRVLLVNQLWLSKKRNGFHLDVDLGIIRSNVLGSTAKFFGTNASLSANWGGWGGIFMSADFLDKDTRVVFGFRGHGMATAPAIGLILLGLLAGGAL